MSDTLQVSGAVRPATRRQAQPVRNHPAPAPARRTAVTPVPRELVHRPRAEDVLITAWRRLGPGRFTVTARWPHDHHYLAPRHGRHHVLLAGETIRQAGLLLSHAEFDVPLGHHFILGDLVYTTDPDYHVAGEGPTRLTIGVECSRTRMRAGMLAGSRFDMTLRDGDRIVARGHSHVNVTSPAVYRRLRGERLTARRAPGPLPGAVPPELTGSAADRDVLLSPTGHPGRWRLRIAPGHATVVNPANDHIPGLALLDAAQQAARVLTAPEPFVPYAFATEFRRYAEHGAPCLIEAHRLPTAVPGTAAVEVTGTQHGEPVFVSTLTAVVPHR
ncbi:ScbA protein [Streptomyces sp. RS10V-4]|uniref:ScbA/BarX family gamma-butyrolactone biosynthesis protein n=1 Tax=Streptomyces rhizoryzae TaxID=2932493 RepID=UPI00200426EE|nr:ScbA/BarX family gamma-butyrolactone biosynthesis protein [Streptomyces rhizoryzae]MCK7627158.1 ScbA protein [Streptomyces rhizoryzae]